MSEQFLLEHQGQGDEGSQQECGQHAAGVASLGENGCEEDAQHSCISKAHYTGGEIHEVESAALLHHAGYNCEAGEKQTHQSDHPARRGDLVLVSFDFASALFPDRQIEVGDETRCH